MTQGHRARWCALHCPTHGHSEGLMSRDPFRLQDASVWKFTEEKVSIDPAPQSLLPTSPHKPCMVRGRSTPFGATSPLRLGRYAYPTPTDRWGRIPRNNRPLGMHAPHQQTLMTINTPPQAPARVRLSNPTFKQSKQP